jgi:hypothetical protein
MVLGPDRCPSTQIDSRVLAIVRSCDLLSPANFLRFLVNAGCQPGPPDVLAIEAKLDISGLITKHMQG